MAREVITLGIGPGGTIKHFLTVGLNIGIVTDTSISLTLLARDPSLTLEARDPSLTLTTRSTSLTLETRT